MPRARAKHGLPRPWVAALHARQAARRGASSTTPHARPCRTRKFAVNFAPTCTSQSAGRAACSSCVTKLIGSPSIEAAAVGAASTAACQLPSPPAGAAGVAERAVTAAAGATMLSDASVAADAGGSREVDSRNRPTTSFTQPLPSFQQRGWDLRARRQAAGSVLCALRGGALASGWRGVTAGGRPHRWRGAWPARGQQQHARGAAL